MHSGGDAPAEASRGTKAAKRKYTDEFDVEGKLAEAAAWSEEGEAHYRAALGASSEELRSAALAKAAEARIKAADASKLAADASMARCAQVDEESKVVRAKLREALLEAETAVAMTRSRVTADLFFLIDRA